MLKPRWLPWRFVPCSSTTSSRWNTLIRLLPPASHTNCDDNSCTLPQKRKRLGIGGKEAKLSKVETHTHRNNKRTQCATLTLAHRAKRTNARETPVAHLHSQKPHPDWLEMEQEQAACWLDCTASAKLFATSENAQLVQPCSLPVQYRREGTMGIDLDRDFWVAASSRDASLGHRWHE